MGAKEILAGKAVVEVGTRLAIQKGLQAAEGHFRKFGATVGKIGGAVAIAGGAAVAGAAAAFAPLLAAAKQFADVGSELDDMAQRTGASVEGLSALGYAARQSGTSLAAVEGGIKKTQKAITEALGGNKTFVATFEALNLSAERLAKLTPERQFQAIAARIGAIEDPATRAAMAMELFGKSGTELLPLMRSNINELTAEASKLGLVMSGENASAAAALGDAIDKASDVIQGAFLRIGAALAPVLTGLIDRTIEIVGAVNRWIEANQHVVVFLAGVAAAVGVAGAALVSLGGVAVASSMVLSALGTVCAGASAVVGFFTAATVGATGATAVFGAVTTAVLAPLYALVGAVGAVVVGVAALMAVWVGIGAYVAYEAGIMGDAFAWLQTKFWDLFGTASTTLSGVLAALASGEYALAAQILWAGVKLAFWQGADAAFEAVGSLFANSLSLVARFNTQFATMIYNGFAAIPSIMQAALTGGSISKILSEMVVNGFDIGGTLDRQVATAKGELDALTAKMAREPAKAEAPRIRPPMQRPNAPGAGATGSPADAATGTAGPPGPDTAQSLQVARARHNQTVYASQAWALKAEQDLQRREAAFMQGKMATAAKSRAALAAATQAKPTTPAAAAPEVKQLGEAIGVAQKEMKFSSVGTFSAAAAGMLGGGSADERVATNTAATATLLRRMAKQRQKVAQFS